jgi:hypothetical protein
MNKIIVFDLDNTIGNFDQIIEIMNHTNKKTKKEVHELFDLFPFVFRTNIFDIFHSIARLKKERKIQSVLLYTNNNNDVFIEYVLSYIHEKLKYTLFDVIISFNQTKNKTKNMDDLLKFAKLNVDNICFNSCNALNYKPFSSTTVCIACFNIIHLRSVSGRVLMQVSKQRSTVSHVCDSILSLVEVSHS